MVPAKITPVVRSLMNSVKVRTCVCLYLRFLITTTQCEEDSILQLRGAKSLAHLMEQCVARKICPNDKILKGLILGLISTCYIKMLDFGHSYDYFSPCRRPIIYSPCKETRKWSKAREEEKGDRRRHRPRYTVISIRRSKFLISFPIR